MTVDLRPEFLLNSSSRIHKTIPHLPRPGTANTDKMSFSNCRFYEDKYPEIDSFVMVNVKQVWVLDLVASVGARASADSG